MEQPYTQTIDKTWWDKANKDYEDDPTLYFTGAIHFQEKALAKLAQARALSAGSVNYEAYHHAFEIIKSLKAD